MADLRDTVRGMLADVEGELSKSDAVEDRIGRTADAWDQSLTAKIQATAPAKALTDDDAGREYLYMLGQRRHARSVAGAARENQRKRGGG